jgi:hypothetical protein
VSWRGEAGRILLLCFTAGGTRVAGCSQPGYPFRIGLLRQ